MKGYDYSRDNLYFVTICVDGMKCCLGNVVDSSSTSQDLSEATGDNDIPDQRMKLNTFGKIVDAQLDWLSDQYSYFRMHSKIVMPNHVHAVIEIDRSLVSGRDIKIKSLSELVGAFKTTSSKLIRRAEFLEFKWKRSFHDHIIRSNRAYQNIVNYIQQNPSNWDKDVFNT
jgi:REP element-mobilizing transposase RayT